MSKYVKYMSILIMLMALATTAILASADIPPDPTGPTNTTGNYWVRYDWSGGSGTDSYNVSMNGTWTNGTITPPLTTNVGSGGWANITVWAYNTSGGGNLSNNPIHDKVQAPAAAADTTPPDPTGHTNTTGNYWVRYDWSGGSGTDSYNVSMNGTWTNGTITPPLTTNVGSGGWANITVWAYNTSGGGNLSNNPIHDKVQAPAAAADTTPPDPTGHTNTTGNYWVRYDWSGGSGTDSYNVSMNGTWTNGTITPPLTTNVGSGGWANITVWAYNTSGGGNLSNNPIHDKVQAPGSSSGYSTGYRIWDANKNMDLNYTWDARSFTGFYYDLDDDTSTETLTIHLDNDDDRTIEEGDLEYVTEAADIDFECNEWGKYKVIGFMAEKYFAGYGSETKDKITSDTISLVSKDMLSKVLIDEDEKHMISTGASLELKEDYELKIIQLDRDGGQAQIELLKNGKSVDSDIVRSPDTYVYTKDLGKLDDVPLVAVNINSVFSGTESDMLVIEGIFQISDNTISVDTGDDYGDMEIKSSSGYEIKMENTDDIDLEEGEIVDIMGNIKFIVADSGTLRFALYEDITSEPGTHDIRGTVYNTSEKPTWDHMNFEGFYYDIDDDLGTEELRVENSGTTIDEGKLVYITTPDSVGFDLGRWGSYEVIGFMAEKYFAGYGSGTKKELTSDTISLISKDMLSKVLIDVEDDRMISTGASLPLCEGYELKIIQLDTDGGQAQIELLKNGKSVDTDIVRSPDTYVYTKDLGKLDDVPIIAIRIGNVFAGTETDMVTIEGAFQISDDPISVDTGDEYGEMEITSASSSGITMKNKENDIDLEGDETIMITDTIGFKVSDYEDRYYLFVRRTIGSLDSLEIEFSETPVVDEELTITVTAASDGDAIEGAEVTFEGENLGLTDSDGKVRFTSEEVGTFTITAAKKDYDSASEEIQILTEGEAEKDLLEIAMLEEVEPGEDVVIKVTSDGDTIEGASIIWDGDDIGETDETGSLTCTAEDAGTYTVTASKAGYLDASEEITVAFPSAEFELADLAFPAETSANKKFTITVDVTNTGDADGTYNAELMVNGTAADSKSVDLDAGETTTVEFTHKISEAGTYTIEIGGESGEIAVTKSGSNTALLAAALIVLAALGAIGYVLISSTPEGGWTVERLIEAIKDKFRKGGEGL